MFTPPIGGRARAMTDCVIEHWDGERAVVHGPHAAVPGDLLVLQVSSPDGEARSHAVRVVSSLPSFDTGTLRFTLVVALAPEAPDRLETPAPGR